MQCPAQDRAKADILLAYCARTLDPAAKDLLERHMAGCEACRRFADEQRAVWSALDVWTPAPVSENFDARLYARIAAEERAPWWRQLAESRLSFSWRPALSLAAACLTVVAVFLIQSPGTPVGGSRPKVELVEVEQAERVLEDLDMLRQLVLPAAVEPESPKTL
jgi:anti-sigma factor RsiW